ncbi:MAG: YbjQ family protein [Betaproteobacteria bacterium]|nr:YbjQ family protein [Betaproteobacteria bacterium]
MEALIQLTFFVLLLLTTLGIGSALERRHYRSIREREARLGHILVFAERQPPPHFAGQPFHLVSGSVVISSDYFKTIAAGLKALVGGRLTSYETLLDRGRREAILRMKEQAAQHGAQVIFNVRLETSTLNQNRGNSIICAELLAYGTALKAPPIE